MFFVLFLDKCVNFGHVLWTQVCNGYGLLLFCFLNIRQMYTQEKQKKKTAVILWVKHVKNLYIVKGKKP